MGVSVTMPLLTTCLLLPSPPSGSRHKSQRTQFAKVRSCHPSALGLAVTSCLTRSKQMSLFFCFCFVFVIFQRPFGTCAGPPLIVSLPPSLAADPPGLGLSCPGPGGTLLGTLPYRGAGRAQDNGVVPQGRHLTRLPGKPLGPRSLGCAGSLSGWTLLGTVTAPGASGTAGCEWACPACADGKGFSQGYNC